MAETEILSRPPAIRLATQNVPPPAGLYVTIDDALQLSLYCTLANAPVSIRLRLLLPDGTISINGWDVSSGPALQKNSFQFSLSEGYILSANVFTSASIGRGQLYGVLQLNRGQIGSTLYGQTLTQGYITGQSSIYFPDGPLGYSLEGNGHLRSVTGATPAAGAECVETVPALSTWRLLSLRVKLVTSAVVNNRAVSIIMDDGSIAFSQGLAASFQPASINTTYNFGAAQPPLTGPTNTIQQSGLPTNILLTSGFRIRTSTSFLSAGDQYSQLQYAVEEWINV
jgi:hypothetical protein